LVLLFLCCYKPIIREGNVKRVSSLSTGFIPLEEAEASSEGILEFFFGETQVTVVALKKKRVHIYQTDLKDANFIVIYKEKYYINESTFHELMNIANTQ